MYHELVIEVVFLYLSQVPHGAQIGYFMMFSG